LVEIINHGPDPSVVDHIKHYCKSYNFDTHTIIDVGVHCFEEAESYINAFDKWIGYEPNPFHYERFVQEYPQYKIHQVALGEELATMTLYYNDQWEGMSTLNLNWLEHMDKTTDLVFDANWKTVPVQVKTLDSYNLPKFDVLKVDAEGWDKRVIRGATNTINMWKPLIVSEVVDLDHMDYINYTCEKIEGNWYCIPKDRIWKT